MPTDLTQDLPLSEDERMAWLRRIERSRELRKKKRDVWETCVQRYLGKPLTETPDRDVVVVNKEFPFVEMKKSQLLFQVPEVQLEPKLPGLEAATLAFQAAVNHELGSDGSHLKLTLDESMFDVLVMGIGPTKIGYAAYMDEREVQEPETDQLTQQPTGAMRTRKVPVLLKEEYFWDRVAPDKFLLPSEFEGVDYDRAAWLAFEFEKDWAHAKRDFKLPDGFEGFARDKAESLSGEKQGLSEDTADKKVRGVEIWYRASAIDPTEAHPDKVRILVLIDGWDQVVKHRPSPYQQERPDGRLMGMKGFPLHPMALRSAADCAYPPSDVEMAVNISDEISKGRTQMVRQRETNIPMRGFDRNRVDPDTLAKILMGHWQGWVPFDGPVEENMIREVARAQFPRENFSFQEIAERDYEEMWALGRNQRGLTEDASRTATEVHEASTAADVRLDAERARVLTWFTTGARKFGALLQLFKTDTSYVEILGPEGAQALQPWDRTTIQGEFVFKAKPDSALRIDAAARRKQLLDLYNLTANDPNVARVELLKTLFRSYNVDPTRLIVEKLPEKGPEPPKVGISFKGEDLLLTPVLQFLQAQGVKIPPEMLQMAQMAGMIKSLVAQDPQQPEHGGAAQGVEPISKHSLRGDGSAPAGVSQRPGVQ